MTQGFDAVGIPTNGDVNSWGGAVMGAGVARVASQRWRPWLQEHLGAALVRNGNRVHVFEDLVDEDPKPKFIFSFPTKHHARDRQSDLVLVHRSAEQLMDVIRQHRWQNVILPQPGTGFGRLSWAEVHSVIAPIMDHRVTIATIGG